MPKTTKKSSRLISAPWVSEMDALDQILNNIKEQDTFEDLFSILLTRMKLIFQTSDVHILKFSLKTQKVECRYHKNGKTSDLKKTMLSSIPDEYGLIREAISSRSLKIADYNKQNAPFIHDEQERYSRIAIPFHSNKRIIASIHLTTKQTNVDRFSNINSWASLFGHLVGLQLGKIVSAIHHEQFKLRVRKVISAKVSELEIALDQADKYNQTLKDFSYIVSHDLREPLRTINSYIKLLDRRYTEQFDADAKDFMHFITDGVERMDRLIQDLLKFSRIEHSVYHFETVSVDDIIKSTCNSLHLKIDEANARVEHRALPEIIGSKSHLQLLFQNLIDNAIKFRKPDVDPIVQIEFSDSDNYWQFSIRDNGVGMNLENKNNERIFKIFQRLQRFGSDIPGTGIGLAICKNIVLAHGGNIWVQSTPGEGSTFHLTISKNLSLS